MSKHDTFFSFACPHVHPIQEALRAALIFHTYEKLENRFDQLVGEVILVH